MLNCSAWHPSPNGNTQIFFYRKKDGAVFYFEKTREGIRIDPEVLTEDFMLCIVPTEELENYKSILPEEEYRVLSKRVEDDNPCVVKFYF